MRSVRHVTLLLLALLLLAPPSVEAATGRTAALQVALRATGDYAGAVDGLAGPGTRAAVARFQRRNGLLADGVAGPRTRRALGFRGRPGWGTRVLRTGRSGWDVAVLQFLLARRGFPSGPVDGGFGPRLAAAVQRFQRHAGLAADGIVGPGTRRALRAPLPRVPFVLSRPVPARATDRFGPRGAGFHAGLDFPAAHGTPVAAAAAGRVVQAGWAGAYGLVVLLDHGSGVRTLYAHLSSAAVAPGQFVGRGGRIGRVGSTGRSTGPHLHLEAYVRGAAVDPARTLR